MSATSPNSNFSSFESYLWVGTNFAGAIHESMFGFDLSHVNLNNIEAINFNAYIPSRHGNGGEVFVAVGLDNSWDENLVTYNSHGGLYGSEQDSNILDGNNLNSLLSWAIDVDDVSIDENYLTLHLYTNDVGADGTNFHRFAGVNYSSGQFSPYLSIEVSYVPIPATGWLFGTALIGLSVVRKKHKKITQKSNTKSMIGRKQKTILLESA